MGGRWDWIILKALPAQTTPGFSGSALSQVSCSPKDWLTVHGSCTGTRDIHPMSHRNILGTPGHSVHSVTRWDHETLHIVKHLLHLVHSPASQPLVLFLNIYLMSASFVLIHSNIPNQLKHLFLQLVQSCSCITIFPPSCCSSEQCTLKRAGSQLTSGSLEVM